MLIEDLKRCPFCGAPPRTSVRLIEMSGDRNAIEFSVYCTECRTVKRAILSFKEEACFADVMEAMDKAERLWNTRAGDPPKNEEDVLETENV